jgi:hypothetical protein
MLQVTWNSRDEIEVLLPAKRNRNVNLDALIEREDFEASDDSLNASTKVSGISINDLRTNSGFFLPTVRKPDFQRETADWDAEKVVRFIESYVNGEFIPSVILWRSQVGLIFVIGGSHRLSSLIAWANDDYGDKQISLDVFEGDVPDEQREIAKETRELVTERVGSYEGYATALTSKSVDPEMLVRARNLGSRAIPIQWIEGDVDTAERSFFNINQQATPINSTELRLLQKRKHPDCIAARAIAKGGRGHKYWHGFIDARQREIERLASAISDLLFLPSVNKPLKTLDVPICDKSVSSLSLVVDLIGAAYKGADSDDLEGLATIDCLTKVQRLVQRMNSNHPGSLGLHPIIYCYTRRGNFRPSSFYASLEFVKLLDTKQKLLKTFIANRKAFEDFIFENDRIVQNIINSQRRGLASAKLISEFYETVIGLLEQGKTADQITTALLASEKFAKYTEAKNSDSNVISADFSAGSKAEVFIRAAYLAAPRCSVCRGLLHKNSISIDHKLRKRDGGVGLPENGNLTHPYCNTGVKN